MQKLRVGIIYGGRSGEHEVSVTSAASIFKNIDRGKYDPVPILIEKDGRWTFPDQPPSATSAAEVIQQARAAAGQQQNAGTTDPALAALELDAVFPILHGPYGEDGTVQGLLELANIPYVGPGVLASAAGMDKAVMKILFSARGLPVCAWHGFVRAEWDRDRDAVLKTLETLGLPVFVKPANLGSSVGISKVKTRAELVPAIETALAFDRKVVVEAAVPNAREIESAVLGNDDPKTSLPGQIVPAREFYDYEAKYLDEGSKSLIPADLPPAIVRDVQRLSIEAFRALDAAGLGRVDFLLARVAVPSTSARSTPCPTTPSACKDGEASGRLRRARRSNQLALARHAENND